MPRHEVADLQAANTETVKGFHMVAACAEHAADLMITTFLQGHETAAITFLNPFCGLKGNVIILKPEFAAPKNFGFISLQRIPQGDVILLPYMELRGNNPVQEISVICNQHQPG